MLVLLLTLWFYYSYSCILSRAVLMASFHILCFEMTVTFLCQRAVAGLLPSSPRARGLYFPTTYAVFTAVVRYYCYRCRKRRRWRPKLSYYRLASAWLGSLVVAGA